MNTLSKNETYTQNHYTNINAYPSHYIILTSTQLSSQFFTQNPIQIKRKRKHDPDLKPISKLKMDHIRIGHSTKQLIKSKAYIGIHDQHDHVTFDSDSFPIVMDTGTSCAISMDIHDFIEQGISKLENFSFVFNFYFILV